MTRRNIRAGDFVTLLSWGTVCKVARVDAETGALDCVPCQDPEAVRRVKPSAVSLNNHMPGRAFGIRKDL